MTVGELGRRMSSRELTEWMAFFRLEPWGTEVEDRRAALITSTVANAFRDTKKQRRPFTIEDFMPRRDVAPVEEQSVEEQARIIQMWAQVCEATFGGGGS